MRKRGSGCFLKVCLQTDEPNGIESEEFHSQHLQMNAALAICVLPQPPKKDTD